MALPQFEEKQHASPPEPSAAPARASERVYTPLRPCAADAWKEGWPQVGMGSLS